jgi:hypothetical protein
VIKPELVAVVYCRRAKEGHQHGRDGKTQRQENERRGVIETRLNHHKRDAPDQGTKHQ